MYSEFVRGASFSSFDSVNPIRIKIIFYVNDRALCVFFRLTTP